jgi:DNA-binding NarL/FixJ family response regulator
VNDGGDLGRASVEDAVATPSPPDAGSSTLVVMIRLALLDDHRAVLAGLQRLVDPARDMEVLAAAGNAVALARELDGRRPDVLITDYDPARADSLSLCRRVKSRPASPRILIYTAYATPALAVAARAAQADGLLDKSMPAAELLDAIRRIAHGETVIAPVAAQDFEAAVGRLGECSPCDPRSS